MLRIHSMTFTPSIFHLDSRHKFVKYPFLMSSFLRNSRIRRTQISKPSPFRLLVGRSGSETSVDPSLPLVDCRVFHLVTSVGDDIGSAYSSESTKDGETIGSSNPKDVHQFLTPDTHRIIESRSVYWLDKTYREWRGQEKTSSWVKVDTNEESMRKANVPHSLFTLDSKFPAVARHLSSQQHQLHLPAWTSDCQDFLWSVYC